MADLDGGADERRRRCADALYGTGNPDTAAMWLDRYPGCLIVSVRAATGRCVTITRTGVRITVDPVGSPRQHRLLVLLLHQWLVDFSSGSGTAADPPTARHLSG
ncbi:hypothetical protein [Actinacidiphila acididurans]|uniref:Uncharacterized protein n=1 Tax=Actinacidiphila acididurans TaxID=2784346 RepID=A0ABS2TZ79_9ACTN|nr:hypothetical protein [Actinacidiphila acididurans]MBM9508649.1 hypothetical protein [Actinacidiphila acididurans]